MRFMQIFVSGLVLGLFVMSNLAQAQVGSRRMTVEDLLAVKSVGGLKLSPDGKLAIYSVSGLNKETGKSNSDLWTAIVNREGMPRQLTTSPSTDTEPAWLPDNRTVVFLSNRSGSMQLWKIAIDGGEAEQITKLPVDIAGGPVVSPDGKMVAVAVRVYTGKNVQETAEEDKARISQK
jgi:Tol biopolymer transport system component